ncbi:hypothetical protein BN970_04775 [Mycolicibacterium conceptionense]|uniref:Uncharacterized protein n=1 Tax=Mycolicibacterium conceptionense TaxID=451644 RepID=A0A0U1DQ49_9MYCO|nr:hypothetical protein BN970_04775 [Mycolicibacterium conceptionense]
MAFAYSDMLETIKNKQWLSPISIGTPLARN